jgi:hypothetical protein
MIGDRPPFGKTYSKAGGSNLGLPRTAVLHGNDDVQSGIAELKNELGAIERMNVVKGKGVASSGKGEGFSCVGCPIHLLVSNEFACRAVLDHNLHSTTLQMPYWM